MPESRLQLQLDSSFQDPEREPKGQDTLVGTTREATGRPYSLRGANISPDNLPAIWSVEHAIYEEAAPFNPGACTEISIFEYRALADGQMKPMWK